MAGPLPNPTRQRRNPPTIPTTTLPAGGRKGRAPSPPAWVQLFDAGKAWWAWAWKTPSAAAWSESDVTFIAHRASLEDDLAAHGRVDAEAVLQALGAEDTEVSKLVRRLAALATGRLQIIREIREIDGRLGLTPKGAADLRWKIVAEEAEETVAPPKGVADLADRRRRIGA